LGSVHGKVCELNDCSVGRFALVYVITLPLLLYSVPWWCALSTTK